MAIPPNSFFFLESLFSIFSWQSQASVWQLEDVCIRLALYAVSLVLIPAVSQVCPVHWQEYGRGVNIQTSGDQPVCVCLLCWASKSFFPPRNGVYFIGSLAYTFWDVFLASWRSQVPLIFDITIMISGVHLLLSSCCGETLWPQVTLGRACLGVGFQRARCLNGREGH